MSAATLVAEPINVSANEVLASHFTLVARPGEIDPFDVPDADGWTSPNPHPVLSLARWTTSDPNRAANALDTILDRFRVGGRGFDWMTGPSEAALLPLIGERGFLDTPLPIAAMAIRLPAPDVVSPSDGSSDVAVERSSDDRKGRISSVMASGFEIPRSVARIYHDAYAIASPLQRTDIYTATRAGHDDPVGVGYLSYIGEGPMVLLRVSATLEGHRGQGVYRTLVRRRLADAAKAGRKIAVVHAYSHASRRALEALGFAAVGELLLHRWRP